MAQRGWPGKRIAAFLTMILLAVAAGVTGIYGTARLHESNDMLYELTIASQGILADMADSVHRLGAYRRDYVVSVLVGNEGRAEDADAVISLYRNVFEENLALYEATIVTAEVKQLMDEARHVYENEYLACLANIRQLAFRALAEQGDTGAIETEGDYADDMENHIITVLALCEELGQDFAADLVARNAVQARMLQMLIAAMLAGSAVAAVLLATRLSPRAARREAEPSGSYDPPDETSRPGEPLDLEARVARLERQMEQYKRG